MKGQYIRTDAIKQKIRDTNIERYGRDYYKKLGSLGGTVTYERGHLEKVSFKSHPERAVWAGAIGGKISRRGPQSSYTDKGSV